MRPLPAARRALPNNRPTRGDRRASERVSTRLVFALPRRFGSLEVFVPPNAAVQRPQPRATLQSFALLEDASLHFRVSLSGRKKEVVSCDGPDCKHQKSGDDYG